MKVKITVEANGKSWSKFFTVEDTWITNAKPSIFRKRNERAINKLSKVLEDVGHNLIKRIHPSMDKFNYYAFFHPMTSNKAIRHISRMFERRRENETTK